MKYFDSHAHYYDERFSEGGNDTATELLETLFAGDVSYVINVATNPLNCRVASEQARRFPNMYTALGIHPSDTRFINSLSLSVADVEEMIVDKANKCVCLGEIGLDYHYPDTDKERQMAYFEAQMQLARELDIPVCIHDREAHADVMNVIRRYPDVHGVLHSFSGSREMAEELVSLGYYISFSGTLTFTNARKPAEVAAVLPHDRVLIETDCPYLAPHPLRGTLNHSGNLRYTNARLAEIWGIGEEECAAVTEENAKRFFGI